MREPGPTSPGRSRPRRSRRIALPGLLVCCALLSCGQDARLNVLLITLDTTRADHLGSYGYESIETPNIDRLAAEGVLYDRCYTPVPVTLPAHLSILSGTYPAYHGVHENAGFYVAEEIETLAEILSDQGYSTAAFVGAYPLDSQTGLDQGFDLYDDHYESSLERGRHPLLRGLFDERPAAEVVKAALGWLDTPRREPFFVWTHFFDPHQPQQPPSPYRERYADAPYDGEIAAVDEAVGQLVERLAKRSLLERTLVVLTADHGEGLGDHGELTHALLLYSSTVRVPLIVRDPRRKTANSRVSTTVSLVDILPTVLDKLGLSVPAQVQGSVLPESDAQPTPRRVILSETLYGALVHGWSPLGRLTIGRWVYIDGPRPRLYDVAADPAEERDLVEFDPERAASMGRGILERQKELSEGATDAAVDTISPEKLARLESLGYVGGGRPLTGPRVDATLPDPHQAVRGFLAISEGKTLIENGRADLGVPVLEHSRRTSPADPFLSMSLIRGYSAMGDRDSVRAEVERLLSFAPENVGTHLLLAEEQERAGELEAAILTLKRAVELDPLDRSTQLIFADRLAAAGRPAEAETVYRQLLETSPDSAYVITGLATLQYAGGDRRGALAHFEQVLARHPFFAPAHLNLAVVRHDEGQITESERLVSRALALRPEYAKAWELRALNQAALGESKAAARAWRQVLKLAESGATTRRARAALEELEHSMTPRRRD